MKAVDNVVGAQLSLPASADSQGPGQCPGFCHVSELADQRVQHPSKYLHPGQEASPASALINKNSLSRYPASVFGL